jgi:putative flippase GtrA
MPARGETGLRGQLLRYIINGLVATAVHYAVLRFNIEVLEIPLAGVANAIAAVLGIAVSFIGSRYFVFRAVDKGIVRQGALFLAVYACIAVLHGLVLYIWTDRMGYDYTIGFILATGMQMACSFVANKLLVFK